MNQDNKLTAPKSSSNWTNRKWAMFDDVEQNAVNRDRWIQKNSYYHQHDINFLNFLIAKTPLSLMWAVAMGGCFQNWMQPKKPV